MKKFFRPYPLAIAAAGGFFLIRLLVLRVEGWLLVLAIAEPIVIIALGYLSYKYWERSRRQVGELELEHAQVLALQTENAVLSDRARSLEESDRIRGDFVESLTHALKNLLAVVRTAADLLDNEDLSDKGQRYLDMLKAHTMSAARLIDDVLKSTKLEVGAIEPRIDTLKLGDWLDNVVQGFVPRAITRRQSLVCSTEPGMPPLLTDSQMMKDVVSELLTNALKYSNPGSEVRAVAKFDKASDRHIIEISNPGFILSREREAIWDRFYRIPKSDPYNQGGTGLGLYLVKQMVAALRGQISLRVKATEGLIVFRIEL